MRIRFGYCPPNPGWNNRCLKYISWYNDPKTAVEAYKGHCSIWLQTTGPYREITFDDLLKLANNDN